MTHSARLANTYFGEWELYVVTDSPDVADWPAHEFKDSAAITTLAERIKTLAALGYEPVPGAEWEWQELANGVMDSVELLAALDVRPAGTGDAA
ncbi:DUF6303 family protein [Streptomyces sp. NPDC053560]|uniref:DUF6303 family protein n=1 Tax=Streptomyces sp. NPDC053560 TaxID=3365711 RepID=UPI0037D6DAF9